MTKTSGQSIIKRLNLLILVVTSIASIIVGSVCAREIHRDNVWAASNEPPPIEEIVKIRRELSPNVEHGPWENYDTTSAEAVKAIAIAYERRVANVSRTLSIGIGVAVGFGLLGFVTLVMTTLSWLLGYGFKVHASRD